MGELRASDRAAVREQLDREPTTSFTVVARCAEPHPGSPGDVGHPLVIRNHPIDAEGRPFPTRYWLTCPDAVRAVARLEADGWIRRLSDQAEAEPEGFGAALRAAHAAYAADRAADVPEAREGGGVGGTRTGVKCLHAHYAYHLAGGDDPVGAWVALRLEPFHPSEGTARVAAVDIGTNSIRLLVVEPRSAGNEPRPAGSGGAGGMPFVELARDMVITRIGQGVDRSGRIEPEALSRTVAVLERYGRRARALSAETIRVTATSAVRDAANRDEVEAAVRRHAGSELRVATGDLEAELCFLGAASGLEAVRPVCVLDIGGGSTEFVVGSARPRRRVSTQMGSVRLTERHVRHDPPTDDELNRLFEAVDAVLEEVERAVAPGRARTLVAVAGTSTTVQAVGLDLPVYDPEAIHRTELPLERAEAVLDRLASMTTAERAALPVMAPGREDVIVAGTAILVQVMRRFGFDRTVVSERDVLDGLILELLGERARVPSSEGSKQGRIR